MKNIGTMRNNLNVILKKQTIILEISSRNPKGHHHDQKVILFQFTPLTGP